MKKTVKIIDGIIASLAAALFLLISVLDTSLPDRINIYSNDNVKYSGFVSVHNNNEAKVADSSGNSTLNGEMLLLGIIPIKDVDITKIDERYVISGGNSFGIKIFTDGVMVVGMSDVDSEDGNVNPAKESGLKIGDIITDINGTKVNSNDEVACIISSSGGKKVTLNVVRNEKKTKIEFVPAFSVSQNEYKAGIWVRDSTAGIGTMTFYSPVTKQFAGLGHAVCDVDTGVLLPVGSGEIVESEIFSINKSSKGTAGELCGTFTGNRLGTLNNNCECGIFGTLDNVNADSGLIKIALPQEVSTGKAEILTTLDDTGIQRFECEIEKIDRSDGIVTNMVIKITDKELLERTGGIVQGMSGSPIIQNGMLAGAVTHVFVNDPERGYGVFADTMFDEMQQNAEELKEAS